MTWLKDRASFNDGVI